MRLTEEVILLLLNDESGYLEQVAGWNLSCVLAGAVLADLALEFRIDTDLESLSLNDATPLGDELLDPVLADIAEDPEARSIQYWVEKIGNNSDEILDQVFERLVKTGILDHAIGGFWSLTRNASRAGFDMSSGQTQAIVRKRIIDTILGDGIPDPRDAILIGLANACDAFRFLLQPDDYETSQDRIKLLSRLDLIGQSVASAVAVTSVRRTIAIATRPIPNVSLLKLLRKKSLREGNTSKLLADLYLDYGPVFAIKKPFTGSRIIFLTGNAANIWVHRHGRLYLRSKEYIKDLETVFGASRSLPGMDGAEHYRMRKALKTPFSPTRLNERLPEMYREIRKVLNTWNEGEVMQAREACINVIQGQNSQYALSMNISEHMDAILKYKNRALITHVQGSLPRFMLRTPRMTAIRRHIEDVYSMILRLHTPALRENKPRDLADDLLSLHASDPQYFPETDAKFTLLTSLVAALYMGNALTFSLYTLFTHPDIYQRVRREAEALFGDGDPKPEDLTKEAMDTTHRLILESLRLYPIVPMQLRNVMNGCIVEGYELPVGQRIVVGSTAVHYLEENYPDPLKFDIDRYLPGREENMKHGAFAAYGLGTHTCLGSRLVEYELSINVLMVAYYFEIEVLSADKPLKINPFPTTGPRKSLKFRIKSKRPVELKEQATPA